MIGGLRRILALVLIGPSLGCLILPMPEHGLLQGRVSIQKEDQAFLDVGKTLREEVLLGLGEPTESFDGDRLFVYRWSGAVGYWFVGAYYSGAGGPIPRTHLLMLEFDEGGRLLRFDTQAHAWRSSESALNAWLPPGTERAPGLVWKTDPTPVAPPAAGSRFAGLRVLVRPFRDDRPGDRERLGLVKLHLDPNPVLVQTKRPLEEVLQQALAAQLVAQGAVLVEERPDLTYWGRIIKCQIWSDADRTFAELVMELEIEAAAEVKVMPLREVREAPVPWFALAFDRLLRQCVEGVQKQVMEKTR